MNYENYISYHKNNALHWEIDTHLDAAVYFADKHGLNIEQRYWLAFLTAICETTPTSLYFFHHFPDCQTTTPAALKEFCASHKGAMAFQYDVRWILYDIDKTLADYKALIGNRRQSDVLPKLASGETRAARYLAFCKQFRVHRMATYALLLYTELLHHLCGVDFAAVIDPATNHSVRSGLIYACGFEDFMKCVTKHGVKPTATEIALLKKELAAITEEVQRLNINPRHKTAWAIETTLYTYNKTRHGRRYLGFYKNRQAKEIKRLSDYTRSIGEPFDWSELIAYHDNWGKWNNRYCV